MKDVSSNFGDLHPAYTQLQAMAESYRCLYCYDAPCIKACPTSIDIPTFIRKISSGNAAGAARTILSANIMGGTCARACPTEVLCEEACVRKQAEEEPVLIGRLQRYAVDHLMAMDTAPYPFTRAPSSGRKIAVVGAGPAGLACAHRAAVLGHDVTVFEAKEKAGGLNEYGLAAYKMANDFAQREVAFILRIGGIDLRFGQRLGDNLSLETLRRDYDAVFVGIGLGASNPSGIEGADKQGVRNAVDFIEDLRRTKNKATVAVGRSVVVIGGGNTAIDAAIQSKLLGAEQVAMVYRRGAEQMSATAWEQELAKTKNVIVREWAKPLKIVGDSAARSVTFEGTRLENGKLVGTGATFDVAADMVLLAIGQTLDTGSLAGLKTENGKIVVDDAYQTSLPGVFAGGDCISSGEDLTVQSVEDGKQSANAIDHWLKNKKN